MDWTADRPIAAQHTHHARLVAAMQRHGIARLLTFNPSDFTRFPGIDVLDTVRVATRKYHAR